MASRIELTNKQSTPLRVPVFAAPLSVGETRTYAPNDISILRKQHVHLKALFPPSVLTIDVDLASGDSLDDPIGDNASDISKAEKQIETLVDDLYGLRNNLRTLMEGCSGNTELAILGQALASNVSAVELNAAPAGTFKRTFVVALRTKITKESHAWNCSTLLVTPGEAVADAQVSAPVVTPNPATYRGGRALLTATFDTDAGATKTYVAGESLTVEVQVAADDKLLGFTVASVTKTFNVVA